MAISFKSLCSNIIPAARYKVQLTDIKFAAGSNSVAATFTILEGTYAKRVHTETISDKAYNFKLMPLLKACKVDIAREFETKEELFKFGFSAAKGKTLFVNMGVRTYNGQEYNNVVDFIPLADSTVELNDIVETFGTPANVQAPNNSLEDVVEVENNFEAVKEATSTEPELNIDLSDIESPF